MKRFLLIALCLTAAYQLSGQNYPAKDGAGNKIYYRVVNAAPNYQNKCVQDNTSNTTYTFLVNDYNATSTKQQFELTVNRNDSTQYYFRNRSSRKYFWDSFNAKDLYNFIRTTTDRTDAALITIIPLEKNQVMLRVIGNDGYTYYLNAADENSVNERIYLEEAQDSRFAWYIINAAVDPTTGIEDARINSDAKVYCQNRHITVTGCDHYTIYDMAGRVMPTCIPLNSGIYIVQAGGKNFKIAVK